jgi:hypothetical protein
MPFVHLYETCEEILWYPLFTDNFYNNWWRGRGGGVMLLLLILKLFQKTCALLQFPTFYLFIYLFTYLFFFLEIVWVCMQMCVVIMSVCVCVGGGDNIFKKWLFKFSSLSEIELMLPICKLYNPHSGLYNVCK